MAYTIDKRITDKLTALGAGCLWQQRIARVGTLEAWILRGQVLHVMHYAGNLPQAGFDVYVPASTSNKIEDTFQVLDTIARQQARFGEPTT